MLNRSLVSSKIQSCSDAPSAHSTRTMGIPLYRGELTPVGICDGGKLLGSIVTHLFVPGSKILSNKKDREKRQVNNEILNLCQ